MTGARMKVTAAGPLHLLPPKSGLCSVCAVDHGPNVPHNAQSLFYGVWFQMKHGRSPTWADAVAHCDEPTRIQWRAALGKHWNQPEPGITPIAEPYTKQP